MGFVLPRLSLTRALARAVLTGAVMLSCVMPFSGVLPGGDGAHAQGIGPDQFGAGAFAPDPYAGDVARGDIDALFEALARAEDPEQAAVIEAAIWRVWAHSGSDTVDLLMQRGLEALEARNFAVALDLLSSVVELAPDYPEGWNKRATLFFMIDDYQAAMADATQALALEPRHWPALMGLAIMFEDLGEPERALGAYRAALEINPQLEAARAAVERLEIEVEGRGI